jgi:hypothetical protein
VPLDPWHFLLTLTLISALITKAKYWEKPTYDTLGCCLLRLAELVNVHKVSRLSMPKIGTTLVGRQKDAMGIDRAKETEKMTAERLDEI